MLQVGRRPETIRTVARRRLFDFTFMYLAVFGAGMVVAGIAWKRAWQPYIGVSFALLFVIWLAWAIRPRLALNLTIFFALVGDQVTISWFPFNKNLSSRESIMWVSDGVSLSPLELTLLFGLAAVGIRRWSEGRRIFARGEVNIPFAIFLVAVVFGFVNGVTRGGDLRIAIIEVRPLFYFPMVYLLAISICDQARHFRYVMYSALAAIALQGLLSAYFASQLGPGQLDTLETLTEHGSSIGMNLLFLMLIMSFVIRGCPWRMRLALMVAAGPVVWVYLLSQRRVAFVSLVVALIMLGVVLFWRQRRTFWYVVPIILVFTVGYVGAFWNSTSPAGFPAQAVKTVVAPESLSVEDQQSDQYRLIENFNLRWTIRSSPLLGLGFGQPFLRPIPLPDISFFEFNEYLPHNSVLWMWIKTGFVGFLSFLYVIARSIVAGVDRVRRQALGVDLAVSAGGLFMVVMFSMYMIGDIAWEPRNSMLFGVCLAMCISRAGISPDEPENPTPPPTAKTNPRESTPPRGRPALALVASN